jgi:cell division protein ZapA
LEKVSVIVQIAGKEYPMKVKASDEAAVLKAAEKLNESLAFYKTNFHISEKQDLLAMVAFDAFFERISMDNKREEMIQSVCLEIESISNLISA